MRRGVVLRGQPHICKNASLGLSATAEFLVNIDTVVEFSDMCRSCICCVKVIHWHVIVDTSSALETKTTTGGQAARVQCRTKLAGGILTAVVTARAATVMTPTWTVTTITPAATHRRTLMVWCGITGRTTSGIHWDSRKWRSGHFLRELKENNFMPAFLSWTITPVIMQTVNAIHATQQFYSVPL